MSLDKTIGAVESTWWYEPAEHPTVEKAFKALQQTTANIVDAETGLSVDSMGPRVNVYLDATPKLGDVLKNAKGTYRACESIIRGKGKSLPTMKYARKGIGTFEIQFDLSDIPLDNQVEALGQGVHALGLSLAKSEVYGMPVIGSDLYGGI
ncbi:MAG: hypothetical protein ACE5FT_01100 [Candidatus Nanoarchaeia archaeon]